MANRVSNQQLEELLEFLAEHTALAKGVGLGARSKETIDRQWNDLATKLNSYGAGSSKTGDRWKRYWADLKHKTKSRLAKRRRDALGTGGGPSSQDELSETDKKVLAIIGESAVFGDIQYRVPVFETHPATARDEPELIEEITTPSADVVEDVATINSPSTRGQTCRVYTSQCAVPCASTDVHTEHRLLEPDPSQTRVESPVSRPAIDRPRLRPRPSLGARIPRIDPEWVINLERNRVEFEGKLADAALIMSEASRVQSEATRVQSETFRQHSEAFRMLVELMRDNHENLRVVSNTMLEFMRELMSRHPPTS